MHAVQAEFRKLFTTRTGGLITLLSAAVTGLVSGLVGANIERAHSPSDALLTIITVAANFGYLFGAILGIIGLGGEYRHQTVTPTFLSVPVRSEVVGAKLVTYLLWGAVLGVVNLIVALVIGYPLLSSRLFGDVSLSATGIRPALWGAVVVCAIFGVIGVGLCALVRNQVFAIVALLVYLLVVENIFSGISSLQGIYPYLPGGLASSLLGGQGQPSGVDLLGRPGAAALLVAYGLVFAAIGAAITIRRDVT